MSAFHLLALHRILLYRRNPARSLCLLLLSLLSQKNLCVCSIIATIYNHSLQLLSPSLILSLSHNSSVYHSSSPFLVSLFQFLVAISVGIAQSVLPNHPHPSLSVSFSSIDQIPLSFSSGRSLTSIPGFRKILCSSSVLCA